MENNKKINILYFEPSSGYGGSSNALYLLLQNLNKTTYNPFVMVCNEGPQFTKIQNLGIQLYQCPFKDSISLTPNKILNYCKFSLYFLCIIIPTAIKIIRFIRKYKIQLTHINTNVISSLPVILASKWTNISCICHIRQTRTLIKIEKLFLSWVNQYIVLNQHVYKIFSDFVPKEKVILIYDGIDLEFFSSIQSIFFRKEYGFYNDPIIGLVGRIVEGKGHEDFIKAASYVIQKKPEVKFFIIGNDPSENKSLYNKLFQQQKDLGLEESIVFTGWRNDIYEIMSELDIIVHASNLPEGLGNAAIESSALGKPIVATKIPGTLDIVVDKETGFLVDPKNPKEMAEAILKLLNNPELCQKMGNAGRKRVRELFDIKKNIEKIEQVYKNLL